MKFQVGDYVEVVQMINGENVHDLNEAMFKGKKGHIIAIDSEDAYPYSVRFDDDKRELSSVRFADKDLILVGSDEKHIAMNKVIYKKPNQYIERFKKRVEIKLQSFTGICEHFDTKGLCTFVSKDDRLLLVHYDDIIQLSPVEG